jgi:hypothetical protein
LRHLNIQAIALALVVMMFLDAVVSVLAMLLMPVQSAAQAGPAFLLLALVVGSLTTALGGAISATKATVLPYWNAAAFGVVNLCLGALLADPGAPTWFNVLAYLSTLPVALAGAHAAVKRLRSADR